MSSALSGRRVGGSTLSSKVDAEQSSLPLSSVLKSSSSSKVKPHLGLKIVRLSIPSLIVQPPNSPKIERLRRDGRNGAGRRELKLSRSPFLRVLQRSLARIQHLPISILDLYTYTNVVPLPSKSPRASAFSGSPRRVLVLRTEARSSNIYLLPLLQSYEGQQFFPILSYSQSVDPLGSRLLAGCDGGSSPLPCFSFFSSASACSFPRPQRHHYLGFST